ncbi:MAG: hypothetical protein DME69_11515 [Verrucomicrobia bacterium]|nr:MAG: hypothetical protein DME69_11515 [Verrucomicrobiota bacterium]PYL77938.1 MAG: hypothetical protein DMF26_02325 [Verrucomicrobiota bacterium]
MAAFHRDDLVFGNISRSKQSVSMDLTLAHLRFGRTIGKWYHDLSDRLVVEALVPSAFIWFAVDTTAATTACIISVLR